MAEVIYEKSKTKEETFTFQINGGGELGIKSLNAVEIKIKFVNDKFSRVEHNIPKDNYDARSYWHIMEGINHRISEIEYNKSAPQPC